MAVESLEQGIYTSQSDVWSFGVLLWEIETGGNAPYAGMAVSELLVKLKAGHRLEKPRYCTDWLYTVMLRCWNANPKTRPTFEELCDELNRMHKQETNYLAQTTIKENQPISTPPRKMYHQLNSLLLIARLSRLRTNRTKRSSLTLVPEATQRERKTSGGGLVAREKTSCAL
ncbi:hypothetical protein OS493_021548 [Desmophyllum pertusum]|uniref:Protein kinase domain-containing protein n=1 Tax=Desmophyllum pertusum TaxID=174260 RepID=A0A9X0CJZ7_9CNID|nr:hypothetical protein OS493_021548 [Desmophyllum pertusum]